MLYWVHARFPQKTKHDKQETSSVLWCIGVLGLNNMYRVYLRSVSPSSLLKYFVVNGMIKFHNTLDCFSCAPSHNYCWWCFYESGNRKKEKNHWEKNITPEWRPNLDLHESAEWGKKKKKKKEPAQLCFTKQLVFHHDFESARTGDLNGLVSFTGDRGTVFFHYRFDVDGQHGN